MQPHQSLAALCAFALLVSPLAKAADENRDYFVFLTTGKSTQGVSAEAVQQKQSAHIANFGRLAKLNELTIAGPCSDPEKKTRGIVVIHAHSIGDAESKFVSDPYVSEGFMKAELHQFEKVVGNLHLVTSEDYTMEESVIVIVSRGKKWTEKAQDDSIALEFIRVAKAQSEDGKLGFAARFTDKSNNQSGRVAVMILRGKDVSAVKKALEEDALFRDERLSFKAFPQYLAKGAIE